MEWAPKHVLAHVCHFGVRRHNCCDEFGPDTHGSEIAASYSNGELLPGQLKRLFTMPVCLPVVSINGANEAESMLLQASQMVHTYILDLEVSFYCGSESDIMILGTKLRVVPIMSADMAQASYCYQASF